MLKINAKSLNLNSNCKETKTRGLLDKGHSKGKQIRMETALKGVLIPLHPGAEKFYKEVGMIK